MEKTGKDVGGRGGEIIPVRLPRFLPAPSAPVKNAPEAAELPWLPERIPEGGAAAFGGVWDPSGPSGMLGEGLGSVVVFR